MADETVKPIENGRDNKGKFTKGNAGGGRKPIPQEFKELAESYSIEALKVAINIMTNEENKTADRLKAIEIVLERGIGKPLQSLEIGNKDGESFKTEQLLTPEQQALLERVAKRVDEVD